jgi:hypothetical protein
MVAVVEVKERNMGIIQVSGYYRLNNGKAERIEPGWINGKVIQPDGTIEMYAGDTLEMLELRSQGVEVGYYNGRCDKCGRAIFHSQPHAANPPCSFCEMFSGEQLSMAVEKIVRLKKKKWWQFWK